MRAEPTSGRRIRIVSVNYNIERPAGAWRTANQGGAISTIGHSTRTMIGERYWPRMPRPLLDKCLRMEAKVLEILDSSISTHCDMSYKSPNISANRPLNSWEEPRLVQRDEHTAWVDFNKVERNLKGFDLSLEVMAAMTLPRNYITPRLSTNREAVAAVKRATKVNLAKFLTAMIDGGLPPHAHHYIVLGQE